MKTILWYQPEKFGVPDVICQDGEIISDLGDDIVEDDPCVVTAFTHVAVKDEASVLFLPVTLDGNHMIDVEED